MIFRFINQPNNLPFQHNSLFKIEWQVADCKWLLIRYYNNEKKRWYKRTERSYRFRRWFLGKPSGTFSNLVNFHSPKIEFYIFSWYIAWPTKITIPIKVSRLSVKSPVIECDSGIPIIPEKRTYLYRNELNIEQVLFPENQCEFSIHSAEPLVIQPKTPQTPVL